MKNYLALLKVYIVQYFAFRGSKTERKRLIATRVAIGALLVVVVGFLSVFMHLTIKQIFLSPTELHAPLLSSLISSLFMSGALVVFILGALTFVSVIFFSKDNELLLGMPVRTSTVFAVKMTTVYLMEAAISALIYIPTLVVIAVTAGIYGAAVGAAYYVLMIFSVVFMPFIPLMLVALVSYPLMYLTTFIKKHSGIGGIILIVLFASIMGVYLYFIYSLQTGANVNSENMTAAIDAFSKAGQIYYPGWLYANAMLGSGNFVFNIGVFLAIFAGLGAIAMLLSIFLYRKNITSTMEHSSNKKDVKMGEKAYRSQSAVLTLLKRDLKEIFQNTNLSFQSFTIVLLLPIISIIFPLAFGGVGAEAGVNAAGIASAVNISSIVMMFLIMSGGTNYSANIAFSREGSNFYLLKVLPVSEKTIIKSKLLLADGVILITAFLTSIFVGVFVGKTVFDALIFFVLAAGYGISINGFTVRRDLKKPCLNWISIREITKNNARSVIPLFIGMGAGLAIMVASIVAASLGVTPIVSRVIIYMPWLAIDIVFFLLWRFNLYNKTQGMFDKIEA